MKIYTRAGDQGETGLLGGVHVPKDAEPLEVCGDLDELNSLLGLARCEALPQEIDALLEQLQRRLFDVGAVVVAVESDRPEPVAAANLDVTALERAIDRFEAELAPARAFILPGGTRAAAILHLARAVCRRAERRLVGLVRGKPASRLPALVAYLNRLSDLLYILARAANAKASVPDALC